MAGGVYRLVDAFDGRLYGVRGGVEALTGDSRIGVLDLIVGVVDLIIGVVDLIDGDALTGEQDLSLDAGV